MMAFEEKHRLVQIKRKACVSFSDPHALAEVNVREDGEATDGEATIAASASTISANSATCLADSSSLHIRYLIKINPAEAASVVESTLMMTPRLANL